jgi:TonB family protein
MNRLVKKCLIATVGFHLLLVLTVVFGAAFFTHHEKPDDTTLLDVIPANLIDAALNSGVKNAQPAAPTPPQPIQQPPTPPTPPQPKPEPVKQPDPEPVKPAPSLVQEVKKFFEPTPPKPEADEPTDPAPKPKPPKKIKVDMTTVKRDPAKVKADTTEADAAREAAKEAKEAKKRTAAAFANAARSIKENATSATTVEMPRTGSVSYANYASVVKSVYERAWRTPDDAANDEANTRVSVTIGSDGTVISSRILDPSGDSKVDASVQRTLDNVNFVAPFPDGAKEKEKTFIINFNLKAKRMLG